MSTSNSSYGGGNDATNITVNPPQATREGSVSLQYPMLTKHNYSAWAMKMEVYMEAQGVWDAVESEGPVENRKDKMALAAIYQGISEETLLQLGPKKTAKEAWNALRTMHLGAARVKEVRAQALRWELEGMKMRDAETIDDFTGKIIIIVNQLRSMGEEVAEPYVVKKILRAVSPKFLQIASTIEEFGDLSTKTIEDVIGSLKAHEERLKGHESRSEDQVLLARGDWRSRRHEHDGSSFEKGRGRGARRGGSLNRGPGRGYPSGSRNTREDYNLSRFDISKIKCYACNEYGHFASNCKGKRKFNEEANLMEQKEDEPALLMVEELELATSKETLLKKEEESEIQKKDEKNVTKQSVWYYDTGASSHMTGNKEILSDIDESINGNIRFGDGSTVSIKGRGSALFECRNGEHLTLQNVYYIPRLRSNIISLGQLDENGAKIIVEEGYLQVFDSHGRLIAKIPRTKNRLYTMKMTHAEPVCLMSRMNEESWLWHARFGHLHFQALRKLAREGLVEGLPILDQVNQVCDCCLVSKQHRSPFPQESKFRAKKPLELVHGDLCGPISPTTPGGNRYFLLMVDDFSRFMWVEFLSNKSDAFKAFKKVKQAAELEIGEKMKVFRSDRGGEFIGREFNEYCETHGIKRQLSAPYSPQQNGVVERRNQTIIEMTRSLLKGKKVPERFWAEAVRTSVYILNRSPTRALQNSTPFQALKGRIPKVSHMRVFGSTAYVKNTRPHLNKLEDRSSKMVFLGYEEGSKAYRFLNPEKNQICISRDATFSEDDCWKWESDTSSSNQSNGSTLTVSFGDKKQEQIVEIQSQTPASESVQGGDNQQQLTPGSNSSEEQSPDDTPASSTQNSSENSESEGDSSSEVTRRFRSLQEIYDNALMEEYEEEMCLMMSLEEPSTYDEAACNESWRQAMIEEMNSIKRNGAWELVDLPKGSKAIGLKWVFKLKKDADGAIIRHKARIVAKGYVQRYGIDFDEVFAPVARLETVRLLMAIAAQEEWEVHHLDVKSAFLNGELEEEVYVSQPVGFVERGQENKVLKLRKALYGLKQAPRAWNSKLDSCLKEIGFEQCPVEHAVYKKQKKGDILIVGVYVDDLIIMGSSRDDLEEFKLKMKDLFEMSDLGLLSYYLGIEVTQESDCITLSQSSYAKKILEKLGMSECKPCKVPMDSRLKLSKEDESPLVDATMYRSAIGSLRYLVHTRPDLTFSVGVVSRYMEVPTTNHLAAVKQILRYIKGTLNHGLMYHKHQKEKLRLIGYCDSDLAGDLDDRKSTTGVIYFLGSSPITWLSQKQRVVALSSCEAEYIAATAGACQGIWLQKLIQELRGTKEDKVTLRIDNKSAISLTKNPVHHSRSKHIDVKYHFVRDCVQEGIIEVEFTKTENQLADGLTKPLPKGSFEALNTKIGLLSLGGTTRLRRSVEIGNLVE